VTTARDTATSTLTVRIPGLLRSYTAGAPVVTLDGATPRLDDALRALDGRYPGLRFRIVDEQGRVRPHIKLFVGNVVTRDLGAPIPSGAPLMIVAALSGG